MLRNEPSVTLGHVRRSPLRRESSGNRARSLPFVGASVRFVSRPARIVAVHPSVPDVHGNRSEQAGGPASPALRRGKQRYIDRGLRGHRASRAHSTRRSDPYGAHRSAGRLPDAAGPVPAPRRPVVPADRHQTAGSGRSRFRAAIRHRAGARHIAFHRGGTARPSPGAPAAGAQARRSAGADVQHESEGPGRSRRAFSRRLCQFRSRRA
jgi:hypothetical protein